MSALQQTFITVLNMSITASYIAAGVILLRLLLTKSPKIFSYILWSAVLIRLVLPVSFTSSFSFLGFMNTSASPQGTNTLDYIPHDIGLMQSPVVHAGIDGISQIVSGILPHANELASMNPLQIILAGLSVIWLAGIVLLLIYSVISYLKVMHRVRTATLVNDNIFESDRIAAPFLCGFIKPKIYVPVGLSEQDLSYITAHERTHMKRLDYLIKPFAFLVLIIHWFNPLMWLSFTLMSRDMEMSCDESVIRKMGNGVKGSYSSSLLSLAVKRNGLIAGSPLAFGESNIKSRIKNVLSYKKPSRAFIVPAIIVTASLLVAFIANPGPQQAILTPSSSLYSAESLMNHKTPYVGNASKVIALIDALPWPAGTLRGTVELQTATVPYGVTVHFSSDDISVMTATAQGAPADDAWYRNAILLFSLIDNADILNFSITDSTGVPSTLTYTRDRANAELGQDVRGFAADQGSLEALLQRVQAISGLAGAE